MSDLHDPSICGTKDDCRLVYGPITSTCMGFQQVYDGHGNVVSGMDPNSRYQNVSCQKCLKSWSRKEQGFNVTWTPLSTGQE